MNGFVCCSFTDIDNEVTIMDVKIVSEKENPLFKRKEIVIAMEYGGPTPSKAALQTLLATKFSTEPQQVEITKILSENGMSRGKVWIKLWEEKRVPLYSSLTTKSRPSENEQKKASAAEEKKEETKPKEEKSAEKKEHKEETKEKPKEKLKEEDKQAEKKE